MTVATMPPPASALPQFDGLLRRKPRSLWADARDRLLRNRAAVIGLVVIVLFVLIAAFANVLAPHNPLTLHPGNSYRKAAWETGSTPATTGKPEFLLGTDQIGRDVLSRTIYGARISMLVGLVPTVIILVVGIAVGLFSGLKGGRIDNLLMRLGDIIYAFPDLLFFVIVMAALRDTFIGKLLNGMFLLFFALSIVNWVGLARLVRGQVLSLREKEFVEAARSIGASDRRIMSVHLFPNVLGPIIISTAFSVPRLIITEAILGYLGIGIRPATDPSSFFITSWGTLLQEGQLAIFTQPWLLLAPSIAVALIVLSFNFVGDGLRDALDPRMRGTS